MRDSLRRSMMERILSTSESIDPVVAGSGTGNLTYVVTLANAGPSDASGVTLSEILTLPGGLKRTCWKVTGKISPKCRP